MILNALGVNGGGSGNGLVKFDKFVLKPKGVTYNEVTLPLESEGGGIYLGIDSSTTYLSQYAYYPTIQGGVALTADSSSYHLYRLSANNKTIKILDVFLPRPDITISSGQTVYYSQMKSGHGYAAQTNSTASSASVFMLGFYWCGSIGPCTYKGGMLTTSINGNMNYNNALVQTIASSSSPGYPLLTDNVRLDSYKYIFGTSDTEVSIYFAYVEE